MVRIHNDTLDTSNYTDWKSNCRNHTQESCVASEVYVVHGCPTAIVQAGKMVNEMGDAILVTISGTTILVPHLQNRVSHWNLRVPDPQMSFRDLTTWHGTRIIATLGRCPIETCYIFSSQFHKCIIEHFWWVVLQEKQVGLSCTPTICQPGRLRITRTLTGLKIP